VQRRRVPTASRSRSSSARSTRGRTRLVGSDQGSGTYHQRARTTEYHDREVKYDYLRLNCAKTIGAAFKYGAGYKDLEVTSAAILSGRRVVAAANANIPTEMAMKLVKEWNARGYGLDVVLYRKYAGSTYVDPHDDEPVAFKDLPNRFPSVLSSDFRKEPDHYEDIDNLFK
jgi:hypothetical protein